MPRGQRERSVRRDPSLTEGQRPVQLNVARRFLTAQGNDKATREARALSAAFGAGTELYADVLEQRNVEGAQEAAFESAAGGVRDADSTTKGYNEMWDEIEAKNDLHLFTQELPEILRGADWENLTEDEAQGVIDGYFKEQLEGINPNSIYGQRVAEGIFAQNAQLLETHRGFQLQRIQQEQRVMIYNEALATFETDGVVDYDTIAKRTGIAFDGAEKMSTYWEVIYDLAIDAGDESIIEDVPERFPSGDPTGINDPKMLADHNTAIAKARAVREGKERDAAAAAAAERERLRTSGRAHITEQLLTGVDPTAATLELLRNGIIKAEDSTAAISAWRTSRDDRAQHGFDAARVNQFQTQLALNPHHPSVNPLNLQQAWAEGVFGPPHSPEAKTAYRQMLQDIEGAQDRAQRLAADPRKKVFVGRFNEAFPIPKTEFGFPVPGPLTELRAEYSAEFELAILQAEPGQYRELFNEYADQYRKAETLVNAQVSARSPKTTLSQLTRGNFTPEQAAAHARMNQWDASYLISQREAGELGDIVEGTPEFEAYRSLLQELAKQ